MPAGTDPLDPSGDVTPGERVECRLDHEEDSFPVQHQARALAERVGFARRDATEIAIAASELASNVIKYGVRGAVVIEAIDHPARGPGVRLTAFDEGPPFSDFEGALRDGHDQAGPLDPGTFAARRGYGVGLGAVLRFSDACGWAPEEHGKRVWAIRFLRRP
ncbi:MAG: ATP-binding protein [Minicystis sp.]